MAWLQGQCMAATAALGRQGVTQRRSCSRWARWQLRRRCQCLARTGWSLPESRPLVGLKPCSHACFLDAVCKAARAAHCAASVQDAAGYAAVRQLEVLPKEQKPTESPAWCVGIRPLPYFLAHSAIQLIDITIQPLIFLAAYYSLTLPSIAFSQASYS